MRVIPSVINNNIISRAERLSLEKPDMFKKHSSIRETLVFADNCISRLSGGVLRSLQLEGSVLDQEIEIGDDVFSLDASYWKESDCTMHLETGFVVTEVKKDFYELAGRHTKFIVERREGCKPAYYFDAKDNIPPDSLADDMYEVLMFLS